MRGSIQKRYKGSWSLILDLGREIDPATGLQKRKQKWVTFRGSKQKAETRLNELLTAANGGTFVEPSKMTLIVWLREWLEAAIKPQCRPSTYTRYHGIIENHISKATIADMLLQKIRPSHLEAYYAAAVGSASTKTLHHAVIRRALRKAMRDRLVTVNVASDLDGRPKRERGRSEDARQHCWTPAEAQAFLKTAKASGPQNAAFYALALDTGARKGELCGLRWSDCDLDAGKIRIVQQLNTPGPEPTFGPPKNKRPRTVALGSETVALLKAHKKHQSALKLANRPTYHDFGLVFAKEFGELRTRKDLLGQPLQANNLGERSFDRIRKAAGIRRIKFHGLRHTCATLLLRGGEPVHVVAERLGHSDVQITLNTYAHVLPDMQQGAADRLGAVLHGR
jgi:integrase